MKAQRYKVRHDPILEAVLWVGNEYDLKQFSKPFPDQHQFHPFGILHFMNDDGIEHIAMPHLSFVVLGITGYFFTVNVIEFVRTYVLIDEPA